MRSSQIKLTAPLIVGLSFLWPCLGSFMTMRFRSAMAGSVSALTTEWHAVAMSVIYLALIVICTSQAGRIEPLLDGRAARRFAIATGIAGLAGHFLLVFGSHAGTSVPVVTALVVAGFILSASFIVAHVLAWGAALRAVGSLNAILAICASYALSYLIQLALNLIPGGVMLALLMLCPAGSAACLCASWAGLLASTAPTPTDAAAGLRVELARLPWRFIVPTIALIYFEQTFSSMLFQRHESWSSAYLAVTLTICAVVWTGATLWVSRVRAADEQEGVSMVTNTLFLVLLVLYMAALLVTVIFPVAQAELPERVLVAAGSCLRTFLWLVIACAVCDGKASAVHGYLVFVLLILAIPLSRITAIGFARVDEQTLDILTSSQVIAPIAGVMLFLISVSFMAINTHETRVLMAATAANRDRAPAASTPANTRLSCVQVGQINGLSPRETDVLDLICHGYTAKAAGERLGISESTVVSHTTHIYRKFGVSSKQDLIRAVEEQREKPDA